MEEPQDLLSNLIPGEAGLDEYRASYNYVKRLSRVILLFAVLIYLLFVEKLWDPDGHGTAFAVGGVIGTIIGASIGFVLLAAIPASLLGALAALLMGTKFIYVERFKKAFWFAHFIMSVLLLPLTLLLAIQK